MSPKKTAINTAKSRTGKKASARVIKNTLTPEKRHLMISEAAYFRAEQRDFQDPLHEQDWFEAEIEIDTLYSS